MTAQVALPVLLAKSNKSQPLPPPRSCRFFWLSQPLLLVSTYLMLARRFIAPKPEKNQSLEHWIWDAVCSSRYIHTSDTEAKETDKALRKTLKQLGVAS